MASHGTPARRTLDRKVWRCLFQNAIRFLSSLAPSPQIAVLDLRDGRVALADGRAPGLRRTQDAGELEVEVRREPAGHAGGRLEDRAFLPELRVRVLGLCHFDLLLGLAQVVSNASAGN